MSPAGLSTDSLESMSTQSESDIAIIGLSALFPRAPSAAEFWSNILNGVDAVDDAPPAWGAERFLEADSAEIGRIYTQKGGFLGDIARFDPRRFGVMPNSLSGSEPDQYHALDLAERALRDAGLDPQTLAGSNTGVIVGHGIHAHRASVNGVQQGIVLDQTIAIAQQLLPSYDAADWRRLREILKRQLPAINVDSAPGLVPNVMTGRIANRFDLTGSNYIIDAACASSLIAVEAAMNELRLGRADLMLAGGINTTTSPLVYAVFCVLGALSRTSSIRPFAAGADGTLLGEGGGMLVLKRLADARRDDDRIYAIIKGVAQSSDGRGHGVMAPSSAGEALAIKRAYQQTGIDPQSISLIECHGTGIPLGDQTELKAMRQVWGPRQRRVPEMAIGSVKSMIGHCIPAAGIASLIKVALALHHRLLPPTLCRGDVCAEIAGGDLPFFLNTEARPWIHSDHRPRRAGINAFGFGGINTHAILEESAERPEPLCSFVPAHRTGASHLLLFAAPTRTELDQQLEALGASLETESVELGGLAWQCYRQLGAEPGPCRAAIELTDAQQLGKAIAQLRGIIADPQHERVQTRSGLFFSDAPQRGKVAFLFPGESAQYVGMLKDFALHFPSARRWLDFLDGLFETRGGFSPSSAILPPPNGLDDETRAELDAALSDIELGSEAAFVADQALHDLLQGFGLRADVYLGHSTGENAALVASGTLDFERDGLAEHIQRMNQVFRQIEAAGEIPKGVLLSVAGIGSEQIHSLVESDPMLYLTMDNADHQVVVFGTEAAIERAQAQWCKQGALCARLALSRGYHTPLLASMADAFDALFTRIVLRPEAVPVFSCVKAAPFPASTERERFRSIAVDQYTEPVRFRDSIRALYAEGVRTFIEVGPSANLSAFVRDILKGEPHLSIAIDDRHRDDLSALHRLLARAFTAGLPLDLEQYLELGAEPLPALTGSTLPTELPFIDLTAADLVGTAFVPETAATAASATDASMAADLMQTKPQTDQSNQQAVVIEHFRLMQEFLAQQERLMTAWRAGVPIDDNDS